MASRRYRVWQHVLVKIPLADSLAAAQAVVDAQRKTGLVAMCGHTRRFNPSLRWIHDRIVGETFTLQQLEKDVTGQA